MNPWSHLNESGFSPFVKDFYDGHSYPGDRYGPSYPYLISHDLWIMNPWSHRNGSGFSPFVKDFYDGHSYPGDQYGPSYPYLIGHDLWIMNPWSHLNRLGFSPFMKDFYIIEDDDTENGDFIDNISLGYRYSMVALQEYYSALLAWKPQRLLRTWFYKVLSNLVQACHELHLACSQWLFWGPSPPLLVPRDWLVSHTFYEARFDRRLNELELNPFFPQPDLDQWRDLSRLWQGHNIPYGLWVGQFQGVWPLQPHMWVKRGFPL